MVPRFSDGLFSKFRQSQARRHQETTAASSIIFSAAACPAILESTGKPRVALLDFRWKHEASSGGQVAVEKTCTQRRGDRAAEGAALEMPCGGQTSPRVRIPPSPLIIARLILPDDGCRLIRKVFSQAFYRATCLRCVLTVSLPPPARRYLKQSLGSELSQSGPNSRRARLSPSTRRPTSWY